MLSIPVSNIDEAIVAFAKVDILILNLTNNLEENVMTNREKLTEMIRKELSYYFFVLRKFVNLMMTPSFKCVFLGRDIDTHMHPSGFLQHLCQPKGEIQLMGKIYHSHSKTLLC